MYFFIADLHFYHKNIIKYDKRPFNDTEEMNVTLIENINKTCGLKDTLWHLGDFSWAKVEDTLNIIKQIKCHIKFIRGNHDYYVERAIKEYYGQEMQDVVMLKHQGKRAWLSHYQHAEWPDKQKDAIHLFGHSHGMQELTIPGAVDVSACSINYTPISWDEAFEKTKKMTYNN